MRQGEESQEKGALEQVAQSLVNSKKQSSETSHLRGRNTCTRLLQPICVLASCSRGRRLSSVSCRGQKKTLRGRPRVLTVCMCGRGCWGGYDQGTNCVCCFNLLFLVVRTTQQNKIPVYCWTTLFHTYIKQAKKINSNFIDKKRKKKKPFIFGLFNHLIQTNYL